MKVIDGLWVDATALLGGNDGSDNVVTLTIADNGPFDTNPAIGVISDPGGLGIPAAPPNRPPTANAGVDVTVAANAACTAAVTLNGSGSSDPDGDPLTYSWTGPFGSASAPNPTVTLALGTSTIALTVDDGRGGHAADTVVVNVTDTTPPAVSNVPAPVTVPQSGPDGSRVDPFHCRRRSTTAAPPS